MSDSLRGYVITVEVKGKVHGLHLPRSIGYL